MNIFWIAQRVLKQILNNKRYITFSILAPILIIYFLKIFLDSLPSQINENSYLIPFIAFVMHFIGFLLCAIVLVQERTKGTLQRMFISNYKKYEVIIGYMLGYMFLGTIQTIIVISFSNIVFSLKYSISSLTMLFIIVWVLVCTSVMLGIFISTFARTEAEVIPFIPVIILPSIFLSGIVIPIDKLPSWAQSLSHIIPMYYANNLLQNNVINTVNSNIFSDSNFYSLILFGLVLIVVARFTLIDTE